MQTRERLSLIDDVARDTCMAVDYEPNIDELPFVSDCKFLSYEDINIWDAQHNGACVYECYGECLGIPWSYLCEQLIEYDDETLLRTGTKSDYKIYKNVGIMHMLCDIIFAVLRFNPQQYTKDVLKSLKSDKEKGMFENNPKAKLSRASYANSDIDLLLCKTLNITALTFKRCTNGGGLTLFGSFGIDYFYSALGMCLLILFSLHIYIYILLSDNFYTLLR